MRMKLARAALCAALAAFAPHALAQAFPSKPVKIVVPFPAGGTTDIVARLVGQRMTETMGQTVVVENRGGAGGQLGAEVVAKAPPDGYTILMHNVTFPMASAAAQIANRPLYNVDTDFAGISIAVFVPLVITASPTIPSKDLKELAAFLQANKAAHYSYGSTGPGSFMHVIGEAFKRDANVEMTHVPLKGAAPLKQELLAGRLQVGGDQLSSSLADIKAGKLRALATNASKRIPELPDVPTVRELGYAVLEADGWNGLFAPAKTPRDVIDRLQRETAAAVKHPDVVKRFTEIGAEPVGSSSADQDAILKKQLAQFRPIIKEMKID
ncbi:MAG: tripartite tricarboxylate transporter substrate binding protein [Burkholderiales bacterium]